MGSPSKVIHGARVKVQLEAATVGVFDSCDFTYDLSVDSAYILGRFSAGALGHTAAEVVRLNCSGWRVAKNGPFAKLYGGRSLVPGLAELLNYQDMKFTVIDRQTNTVILTVYGVCSSGFHGGYTARQLSKMSLPFVGVTLGDESMTPNAEPTTGSTGATEIPSA